MRLRTGSAPDGVGRLAPRPRLAWGSRRRGNDLRFRIDSETAACGHWLRDRGGTVSTGHGWGACFQGVDHGADEPRQENCVRRDVGRLPGDGGVFGGRRRSDIPPAGSERFFGADAGARQLSGLPQPAGVSEFAGAIRAKGLCPCSRDPAYRCRMPATRCRRCRKRLSCRAGARHADGHGAGRSAVAVADRVEPDRPSAASGGGAGHPAHRSAAARAQGAVQAGSAGSLVARSQRHAAETGHQGPVHDFARGEDQPRLQLSPEVSADSGRRPDHRSGPG